MRRGFYIRLSKADKEYFVLKANNSEIILTSEEYESRQGLMNGIQSVRNNAARIGSFKRFVGKDGQFYFNMLAMTNKVIGVSEGYVSKYGREIGILSVRVNAIISEILY
jgi:hypothetical protein